ncbi:hypothetical protein GF376_04225 [Candidatus Peregrinibacteria bacterium]|nr:hypothetical protein [Candidatus Peregrinibacteria bacterium]
MNYSELQLIIRYIKKSLTCSSCTKCYKNEDIEVLSTFDDQGLFHLHCHHCHTELIVHVTLSDQEAKLSKKNTDKQQMIQAKKAYSDKRNHVSIKSKNGYHENISMNDVIDMHQFLNSFDGDFRKLFSEQK